MQLRGTEEAANDLEAIASYLFEHAPERAADLVREINNAPLALLRFPYRGRVGRRQGTRELVIPRRPYIVVYELLTKLSTSCEFCTRHRSGLEPSLLTLPDTNTRHPAGGSPIVGIPVPPFGPFRFALTANGLRRHYDKWTKDIAVTGVTIYLFHRHIAPSLS